ncbi:MAG: TIGR04149 family rSAM-modified RiPP [Bacteroides sp.]|nr:TIGR04149 family rSAM-modified RiPP [Bacteroides sp.]
MRKLKKISLSRLYKDDMAAREMNMLRGGNNCGCSCNNGPSSKEANYSANWERNIVTDNSVVCSWEGSGEVTVYGGSIVP